MYSFLGIDEADGDETPTSLVLVVLQIRHFHAHFRDNHDDFLSHKDKEWGDHQLWGCLHHIRLSAALCSISDHLLLRSFYFLLER